MTTQRSDAPPPGAPLKHPSRGTPHPPASVHSVGHSAGLHPEDRPYPSCALAGLTILPALAPPLVEKQWKLVLNRATRPSPPRPSWPDAGDETRHHRARLGQLATIGYCQPGAEAVMRALLHQQDWLLVDIRLTPWSYYPQWQGLALAASFGTQYLHLPELGNLNADDATLPIRLANPDAGIGHLLALLDAGRSCLLVCGCPDFRRCHRAVASDLVQQARPPLQVWHLACEVAPAQSVEVTAMSRGALGVFLDLTLTHAPLGEAEQPPAERILVTPLSLSVRVPGRGSSRHLDFVSWPSGGRPARQEQPPEGACTGPRAAGPAYRKETPPWNR
jgi:hypothetical protein